MAILKPDKIRTEKTRSGGTITIKEKIIPDNARAKKKVASYVTKGALMKPCAKLTNGTGKPRGITIHNTNNIITIGTTPAEQYTRATWPNCNMGGSVVHFYVYKTDIWQNLSESEQGWHAADGATRRAPHRAGEKIGGNLDTIAIECIGNIAESEDTTAKLAAYLCAKYGLDPELDIYTHKEFYAKKNCPAYILPHWKNFIAKVKQYCTAPVIKPTPTPAPATPSKPAPAKTVPAKSAPIEAGDTIIYSGRLYATSTGLFPGKTVSGSFKVDRVIKKRKCGIHIPAGWIEASKVKRK